MDHNEKPEMCLKYTTCDNIIIKMKALHGGLKFVSNSYGSSSSAHWILFRNFPGYKAEFWISYSEI